MDRRKSVSPIPKEGHYDRSLDGKRVFSVYNQNEIVDGSPMKEKKQKKKNVDGISIPKEKNVCLIMFGLCKFKVYFMADIDWAKSDSSWSSNSDENNITDLERVRGVRGGYVADELKDFKPKKPNVVIDGFLDPGRFPCFCAIDDTLFIFDGNEGLHRVFTDNWNPKHLLGVFERLKSERKWKGVYRLNLSDYLSPNQKVYLDEASINKSCDMLGDKWSPAAIRYGENKILVFSTRIAFADPDAWSPSSSVDFELYSPESNGFTRLPRLRVRRTHDHGNRLTRFALLGNGNGDGDGDEEGLDYFDPFYPRRQVSGDLIPKDSEAHRLSFTIVAHSLIDEHVLVVQADFGQLFSLDLASEKSHWQLFKAPLFPCTGQNFVIHPDGGAGDSTVLSPLGVHKYEIGVSGRGGTQFLGIDFPLPLCSRVSLTRNIHSKNYLISLIKETRYITCVAQFGFDKEGFPAYWTLDLVHFIPCSRKAVKLESFKFRSRGTYLMPVCVFAF